MPLRLLLLSTPVGPLGSGLGGGVELTVTNLAGALTARGHQVAIAAPMESRLPEGPTSLEVIQIPGNLQSTAQTRERSTETVVSSVLANTWEYARKVQSRYDLLVNFAYDWLPFYLTPFFETPIAHFVSMGSLSNGMDEAIAHQAVHFPGCLGAYTRSQADTFIQTSDDQWQILGSAVDIDRYDYCEQPNEELAWAGRISPEKGLEDAVAAAAAAGRSLKIFGKVEDHAYWQSIQQLIAKSSTPVEYCGFLPTDKLQKSTGRAQALLVTPKWIEAFGIVAIEALACGVPVIAYKRGGLAEVVRSGETGWLVNPDDVLGLVKAIAKIDQIDRQHCRQQAVRLYSLSAWSERFERWFYRIVSSTIIS